MINKASNLRARACTKCEEYVVIHPNNPISQRIVSNFEVFHRGHPLVTIDLNEVKEKYDNYTLIVIELNEGKTKYKYKKIEESQLKDSKSIDIRDSNNSKSVNSGNIEV